MATSEPKVKDNKKGSAFADDETKAAIYEGLNMSQLMVLFKRDYRTVQRAVFESKVKPVGKRYGADIYAVHEIAPYLVKPVFDVEAYIRRMDHRELPQQLTKEFWAGQKVKQDVEERAGLLWRTEKVVEEVGELFKVVKMSALLMLDAVERASELNDRQRSIIRSLTHGMLDDLTSRIEKQFKVPANERQEAEDDEEL
jgi:hypothetical protein